MKKSIISMMLVGMMMLGTGTSFGSTKNNQRQSPKTEQVINTKSVKQNSKDKKTCDCKTCKELVKKQQTKKCNCKNCQKQQKKSGPIPEQSSPTRSPSCKIQPNVRQTVNRK